MNSQPFESNYNKLRAIIQAYLNTNKTWIANDFRGTDPMEVDHIGKSKGKGKGNSKSKSKGNRKKNSKGGSKDNGKSKGKGKSKGRNHGKGKSNSTGKGSGKLDNDKEGSFRRASVNVCPKWFRNFKLEQSEGATCLRGANGKPLQEYGKRQIWLRICGQTKRYDFRAVNVTKPILSASCLCEQGVETHLAKNPC